MSKTQPELESSSAPVLPRLVEIRQEHEARMPSAGRITPVRVARVAERFPTPRERGLEVREFVRAVPVIDVRLKPAGEVNLSHAEEPGEVIFNCKTPADNARPWHHPDREFAAPAPCAGELARLSFQTTGWSETALAESAGDIVAEPELQAAPAPALKPAVPSAAPIAAPPQASQVRVDPIRFEPVQAERVVPRPIHFEPVHIEPVFMERITSPAVVEAVPLPASPPEPEPAPGPAPAPLPEPVTKPLPVTLHGLAPSRGKAVQVFASALTRPAEILPPPQSGLPLRPLMVLAPAPEAQDKAAALVPARPAAEKQEQRQTNAKGRKPEVRVLSLQLREDSKNAPVKKEEIKLKPEQRPEPKPEAKPAIAAAPPPRKIQNVNPQAAPVAPAKTRQTAEVPAPPKAESPAAKNTPPGDAAEKAKPTQTPKPTPSAQAEELPKPAPPELESLGLPKLAVEADGNFWSKLPAAARLGVAAGFLALIAGGIFLTSRGSSAPRTAGQQAFPEVGPPMTDAGWATDWFTDGPASKASRHVDVLRGSLTLRDYRIEFEGQIEHQAIGWVFRANNKSFYAEKIAIAGPGFEPPIELVRIAVMNGKEQLRQKIPLPFKVHLDTMYKVRTDVIGNRFVTWIQGQKVDDWTDPRIDAGGVGLYYDSGDVPKLKDSINVMTLRPR